MLIVAELPHWHKRCYPFASFDMDQVDYRFPARGATSLRHVVDLEPVNMPRLREEQHVVVSRSHE